MYELREYNIKDKEQVIKLWIDICIEEHRVQRMGRRAKASGRL